MCLSMFLKGTNVLNTIQYNTIQYNLINPYDICFNTPELLSKPELKGICVTGGGEEAYFFFFKDVPLLAYFTRMYFTRMYFTRMYFTRMQDESYRRRF